MSKKIGTRMQPFTVTGDNIDGIMLDLKMEINDFLIEGEATADWFNFIDLRFNVLAGSGYDRQYTVVAMVIYETDCTTVVKKVTSPSGKAHKKTKKAKKAKKPGRKAATPEEDEAWDTITD